VRWGAGALVVDELLVVEAVAVFVDGDHRVAAQEPHARGDGGEFEDFLENLLLQPGFVHIAQLGADLDGEIDQVALIGGNGAAAQHRHAQIVLAHLGVLREAARAEDHAPGGADEARASRVGDLDADNVAVLVEDDPAHLGVGDDRRALGFAIAGEADDDVAAIAGLAFGVQRVGGAAALGNVLVEMSETVGRRLAAMGMRHGRGQGLLVVQGFDDRAGIVVEGRQHLVLMVGEAELRVAGAIERGEAEARHVFERVVLGVDDAGFGHERAVGNPVLATRLGGGAARDRALLVDIDLGAAIERAGRTGKRRAARADDHDVGGFGPFLRFDAAHIGDAERGGGSAGASFAEEVAARHARRPLSRGKARAGGAVVLIVH